MSRVAGSAGLQLARLLRELRRRSALTQEALAEAAGLSVRTVRNVESGKGHPPQSRSVRQIAGALRLDASQYAELLDAAAAARFDRRHRGWRPAVAPVPSHTTDRVGEPLIGRDDVVDAISAILRARPCLVSITGLSGIGKTSVAAAVAERVGDQFTDGTIWVKLRSRRDLPAICQAVAEAARQPDLASLAAEFGGRRALLVIDGIEYAEQVAAGLAELRATCPSLHILVTGRRPTGATDEYQWVLGPLAVPAEGACDTSTLGNVPAVAMFVDRLLRRRPDYRLTDDGPAVAALARLFEGVPLALELAAGWGRLLSPRDLLDHYRSRRLDLAWPGRGPGTLREALAESWSLLSDDDQWRLAELALLVRSWPLELARDYLDQTDDVDAFVDQVSAMGLVRTVPDAGSIRFHLPESVREFGLEHLAASARLASARERHARVILRRAGNLARQLTRPDHAAGMEELYQLGGDIGEALAWAAEQHDAIGLETAAAPGRYWRARGRAAEGVAWIKQLLADAAPASIACRQVETARLLGPVSKSAEGG